TNWTTLLAYTNSSQATRTFVDTNARTFPRRYYRAVTF
ncbi:MAG: hypothetical protein QOF48_206, partial [Verrucomicrobiota bacterium]